MEAVARAQLPSVEEAVDAGLGQATASSAPETAAAEAPPPSDEPPSETSPPAAAESAADPESPAERAAEAAAAHVDPAPGTGHRLPELVEAVLLSGFFLSIDGRVVDQGRTFYRTVRNRFVRADHTQ